MKKRVADIIMELLVKNNITQCFAVVGGGAMHLDNALALNDNINKVFIIMNRRVQWQLKPMLE